MSRVELSYSGIGSEILRSPDVLAHLESVGQGFIGQLGDGYEMTASAGNSRSMVRISAETEEAVQDNLENNTLLKVVGL